MAHLPEIPASAYTPEMDILGVDLGKARAGGSSIDASAFWDLLDPPMRSRVVAAGFGDYATSLCRTQPRFPPAMRYALMERWNDCTHSFIFGFGEMTLTPADFTAITGLDFDGEDVPLDSQYQTATLGAELVRILLDVPTRTRYTAQGYISYEVVYKFWPERIHMRLAAWRELPVDARPVAPAYTREERDQAARAFIFYIISSQLLGSGESNWQFLPPLELLLTPWEGDAWAAYPPRALAEALTRSRVLLHGYWVDRYYLGERILEIHTATAQRRVPVAPPRHMCILEGMTPEDMLLEYDGFPADGYLIPGDYASYLSTRWRTRLPDVREYAQERRRHRTPAFYEAQAEVDALAESVGAVLGEVPFPPGMEVALDPTLGLGPAIAIPADLRQAPPQLQLDPEHATHVPTQRYQELYQRFCFAQSYIARLYPERHDMELEIGRLRRHQSRQAAAVSHLQIKVDRLRTRLEVEGIPLDFSEDEDDDDDDGSSSDDAPPPPPSSVRQAAAGRSRRRR
ncbi:hypothetical protein JCGZ_19543 [Jatropha curcas]|uniref:Aminotransferase-like plant mobile domain-containing protein n=1 Tax=Jatropha curcas TaxID=180498 RepID=A0A067LL80_JATCU|nr:hypothetical protein JCGZ_19543 [Jatropha curcas]